MSTLQDLSQEAEASPPVAASWKRCKRSPQPLADPPPKKTTKKKTVWDGVGLGWMGRDGRDGEGWGGMVQDGQDGRDGRDETGGGGKGGMGEMGRMGKMSRDGQDFVRRVGGTNNHPNLMVGFAEDVAPMLGALNKWEIVLWINTQWGDEH